MGGCWQRRGTGGGGKEPACGAGGAGSLCSAVGGAPGCSDMLLLILHSPQIPTGFEIVGKVVEFTQWP